jgi:hypothetical protein
MARQQALRRVDRFRTVPGTCRTMADQFQDVARSSRYGNAKWIYRCHQRGTKSKPYMNCCVRPAVLRLIPDRSYWRRQVSRSWLGVRSCFQGCRLESSPHFPQVEIRRSDPTGISPELSNDRLGVGIIQFSRPERDDASCCALYQGATEPSAWHLPLVPRLGRAPRPRLHSLPINRTIRTTPCGLPCASLQTEARTSANSCDLRA